MRTERGLRVVPVHDPHKPDVKIWYEGQDHPDPREDKRTSFRFFGDVRRETKDVPLDHRKFFSPRDRDLGQTFTTPTGAPLRLSAVTLRTGPVDLAVGPAAHGRRVSMQFFAVGGAASIFDVHGHPIPSPDHRPDEEKRGDYITGESYEPVLLIRGGHLPDPLVKNQWLRWELPHDALVLDHGQRFAFLVMFDDPLPDQELALANNYHAQTPFGGHGIRREGNIAQPWSDTTWVNNPEAASLPDWEKRLTQPPNTWGRPDVDTYRV
jgi:hypothetical protein